MVQSNNSPSAQGPDDTGEIDKIMQEIEDLEKRMETPETPAEEVGAEADGDQTAKIVPIRSESTPVDAAFDDALSEVDGESGIARGKAEQGGLSLRIGDCTEISLEFAKAGVSVSLYCSSESLTITTDQGAEFRIPFRKAA